MSSSLGQLPKFGAGRRLNNTNDGIGDLDDDLEFLLGDKSKLQSRQKSQATKTKSKGSASKSLNSDGDDFYGKMGGLTNERFDRKEEDAEPFTEADSKKLADSVNCDDMDANLFGSFSRSQNQRRRQSSSRKGSSVLKPSKEDESGQGEADSTGGPLVQHGSKTQDSSLKHTDKTDDAELALKTTEKPKDKKSFGFDDDDLLDLLSDSGDEDLAPKKREKPKIQLTSKPKSTSTAVATASPPPLADNTPLDGKPITSTSSVVNGNHTDELVRPRTSRGNQSTTNTNKSSAPPRLLPTSENETKSSTSSGVDVLKLDDSLTAGSLNSTQVDFDDAGDDLLSGMGLDDSDVIGGSAKPPKGRHPERRGSILDELLGTKSSSTKSAETKLNREKDIDGEGDGFQFGGYLPSAAADSVVSTTPTRGNKSNLKIHSDRRGSSELSDVLASRPGSAPTPAKKSVRFADATETSERPSSSPATSVATATAPPDSRGGGSKRLASSAVLTPSSEVDVSSKPIREGSKKPPLPRRTTAVAMVSGQGKAVEEGGESPETEGGLGSDDPGEPDDEKKEESKGSDSFSGLFPGEESTPKKAPVRERGRGRRTSLTKPASSSLFEDNHEEPQTTTDSVGRLAGDESLLVKKEGAPEPAKMENTKLERPVFPWQKGRLSRSQSLGGVDAVGSAGPNLPAKQPGTTTTTDHVTTSHDQNSQLASFQEMLLQQQKLMQEQFALSLQKQVGGASTDAKFSFAGEERLNGEVKSLKERVEELERQLQIEKSGRSEVQSKARELEQQLEGVESERKRLEDEAKRHRNVISELESGHQKTQLELTSQIEELKMKVHRSELERTQLQYSVESGSSRHAEEVESIQKSHESRIKAMEESFQRREAKWREEAESETSRHQEKLQQSEREKMDAVLALKKKIDVLEVSKTNEISRLQDIHRTSVEDLKREHEQDKHHLLSMHRQEVEALKAAHSHTRMLSELTHQVETSTREVSQLQAKLEQAHSTRAEEQAQRAKIHQEQLKTLEERLMKQQTENSAERERLHLLISKLESHIAQQSKTIEQEKWQLQQDASRLKMRQTAFEEERASFLNKMEEDRDQLQRSREKFLVEQREVLAKCYEERRGVATERAELEVLKRRLKEQEQRNSQKNLEIEAELEASRNHIREESARISSEATKLRQEQLKLKTESEAITKEKERLEALEKDVEQHSQETKNLCQSALAIRERGEQSLCEAEKMKGMLESRSKTVEQQMLELREREKRFAAEQLSLVRQRRERDLQVQDLHRDTPNDARSNSPVSSSSSVAQLHHETIPTTESIELSTIHSQGHTTALPPISHESPPLLSSSTPRPLPVSHHHHLPLLPPCRGTAPTHQFSQQVLPVRLSHLPLSARLKSSSCSRGYGPASGHVQQLSVIGMMGSGQSITSELAQIEHTRNLRQLALLAEQDYQDLEEETKFLQSLENGGGYHFSNNYSSLTANSN